MEERELELPEPPELPKPHDKWLRYEGDQAVHYAVFTADQMRAYGAECARQAVMAERERAARIAESDAFYGSAQQHMIAEAIRKG